MVPLCRRSEIFTLREYKGLLRPKMPTWVNAWDSLVRIQGDVFSPSLFKQVSGGAQKGKNQIAKCYFTPVYGL